MKKLLLFLLVVASYLSAGKCHSRPQPMPDDSTEEHASSDPQAMTQICVKCNEPCDRVELLPFCSGCNVQICFECDNRLSAQNEIFLDQTRHCLFVRTTCFACNRNLAMPGIKGTMRHAIMARRINSGELCKPVKLFCEQLPPSDQHEQEWDSCSSE